jgi:hypothetical protein
VWKTWRISSTGCSSARRCLLYLVGFLLSVALGVAVVRLTAPTALRAAGAGFAARPHKMARRALPMVVNPGMQHWLKKMRAVKRDPKKRR